MYDANNPEPRLKAGQYLHCLYQGQRLQVYYNPVEGYFCTWSKGQKRQIIADWPTWLVEAQDWEDEAQAQTNEALNRRLAQICRDSPGDLAALSACLAKGANPNILVPVKVDEARPSRIVTYNLLSASGYPPNELLHSPLLLLCDQEAPLAAFELLIEAGADTEQYCGYERRYAVTLLGMLIHHCRADVLRLILAKGTDPNLRLSDWQGIKSNAALAVVVQSRFPSTAQRLELANILLDAGAELQPYDPEQGEDFAHYVIEQAELELLRLFYRRGMDFHRFHEAKVQYAFWHKRQSPLTYLLSFWEEAEKRLPRLKLLAEEGLDLRQPDGWGNTCLFWSALKGSQAEFEFCLSLDFDLGHRNLEGQNVLLFYLYRFNPHQKHQFRLARLQSLAERGADSFAQDLKGRGLLHYCLEKGQVEAALHFWRQGLDAQLRDNEGISPLQMAKDQKLSLFVQTVEGQAPNQSRSLGELSSEILRQGFELVLGNERLNFVPGNYGGFRYTHSQAKHYKERQLSSLSEAWLEEFMGLRLLQGSESELKQVLRWINAYLQLQGQAPYGLDNYLSLFSERLRQMLDLKPSLEALSEAAIRFLESGGSFDRSDKEGMESYHYLPQTGQFEHFWDGDYGRGQDLFERQAMRQKLERMIYYPSDASPLLPLYLEGFVGSRFNQVLSKAGFSSLRSWYAAEALPGAVRGD